MDPQIYLIAPPSENVAGLRELLDAAMARQPVAALLVPRARQADEYYRTLVAALSPTAQMRGVAVLIEGAPGQVRELGVDGLHIADGLAATKAAISTLKPDFIVGAGNVRTRHDAMQLGEAGVDYILFGPLSGPISSDERELARWWAQTMEIPGVLSDPDARVDQIDAAGCEFIGLGLTEQAG